MNRPHRHAVVRSPSDALEGGARTFVERAPIDVERARSQHAGYADALRSLGVRVTHLPELPGHPDAVFVEDAAVVLDRAAVITRSSEASRRGEGESILRVLAEHRATSQLEAPATLDGGDVLRIGARLYVGRTARSNDAGREALRHVAEREGMTLVGVDVAGCLHLKTGCTCVGTDTLLFNPAWVDGAAIDVARRIEVDPAEPFGANTLTVGEHTLVSASAPRTAERLRDARFSVRMCDISELEKAEAGLTCLSLVY